MTKVFPIILTPAVVGYVVTVPDLDINTQGKDMAEAIYMARDAIGLWGICEIDDGRSIPEPSMGTITHEPSEIISWVDIDFDKYRLMNDIRMKNEPLPHYHINIFFSHEDEGYIADIPDLKNCSAFGATSQEALNHVLVAQKLWLEEAQASNMIIPEPKYRPMRYQVG